MAEAIGLGLVVSLLFTEAVGFAAGGFVVPGYIALYLDQPWKIAGTLLASFLTFASLKFLGQHLLLYGRRNLVLAVLLGFLFGGLIEQAPRLAFASFTPGLSAIGFIIPGLIAYWMTRQGVFQTLAAMIVASIIVRLGLITLHGGALLEAPLL